MTKIEKMKEQFAEFMEMEADKVNEKIAKQFEKIVQLQLDEWKKRFHRHTFTAECINGSLSFVMSPPLKGCPDNRLAGRFDYIPAYMERGAVADLLIDAAALQDLFCIEYNLTPNFLSGCEISSK